MFTDYMRKKPVLCIAVWLCLSGALCLAYDRQANGVSLRPLMLDESSRRSNRLLIPYVPYKTMYARPLIVFLSLSSDVASSEDLYAGKRLLIASYDDMPRCFPAKYTIKYSAVPEIRSNLFIVDLDAVTDGDAFKTIREGVLKETRIGRNYQNALRIILPRDISGEHLVIRRNGNEIEIEDRGSKNRTSTPMPCPRPSGTITAANVLYILNFPEKFRNGTYMSATRVSGIVDARGIIRDFSDSTNRSELSSGMDNGGLFEFSAEIAQDHEGGQYYILRHLHNNNGYRVPILTILTLAASLDEAAATAILPSRELPQSDMEFARNMAELDDMLSTPQGVSPDNACRALMLIRALEARLPSGFGRLEDIILPAMNRILSELAYGISEEKVSSDLARSINDDWRREIRGYIQNAETYLNIDFRAAAASHKALLSSI